MDSRLRLFRHIAVLLAAICVYGSPEQSHAQNEPSSISNLTSNTDAFSASQRQAIATYATYWSEALRSEDMQRAQLGKRRLIDPLRSPGVRRLFLDEYARAAIPELRKAVESDNDFAAVNALQVIAAYHNDTALDVMSDHCDVNDESRWQVRLWAAHGISRIARQAQDIPQRTMDSAVRDLERAGERETHWLVLQRQFEALAAIGSARGREGQITLLETTLDRMDENADAPSEFVQPVHRSLVLLRDQYVDVSLTSEQRRTLSEGFTPLLERIRDIDTSQWSGGGEHEELLAVYGSAQELAGILLGLSQ